MKCPICDKPMEKQANKFYWRGEWKPGWVCHTCPALFEVRGDEIEPLKMERSCPDVAICEQTLKEAVTLLRFFVAFHSPGDMPKEFSGGQMVGRLEEAKEWLAGFSGSSAT